MKWLLIICLLSTTHLMAQTSDSLSQAQDDAFLLEEGIALEKPSTKGEIIPKKALLYSIVPGGGQIYNRRWWKVPIVYGAFAGIFASIEDNQRNFRRFQDAFQASINDEPHEFTGTALDNTSSLRTLRDNFDKNRQTAYVFLVIGYALQGIEAFVDAHLRDFDGSDDLSIKLRPKFLNANPMVIGSGPIPVLSVQFTW